MARSSSRNGWHRGGNPEAKAARAKQYASKEHKAHRLAGKRQVEAGIAHCWRCGRWIPPGSSWHVGHDDWDRTIYRGTECVECNLGAAARKGNAISNGRTVERTGASYPLAID